MAGRIIRPVSWYDFLKVYWRRLGSCRRDRLWRRLGGPVCLARAKLIFRVTDEIDIYRAAKLYIDQHGDQAALQAATRSDALLATGLSILFSGPPTNGAERAKRRRDLKRANRRV